MNRREYITVLGAVVSGCVSKEGVENMTELSNITEMGELGGNDVTRAVDEEAGVVIYLSHTNDMRSGSGITTIPIEDTALTDN